MKVFPKVISVVLTLVLLVVTAVSVSAAQVDLAPTGAHYGGSLLAADFDISGTTLESNRTLPSSYSSKDSGYVTPVRTQLYNTCWAYSSSATLETTLMKKGVAVSSFSPMHMNHWGTTRSDGSGWLRDYNEGGYAYISMGYFTSWQGPRLESDYPEDSFIEDFSQLDRNAPVTYAVDGIVYLDGSDIETVKTAVYEYGAVVGNYHVNDSYYDRDNYAYYCNTPNLATSQLSGHAISIVGWDDNFSKENFSIDAQPENDGAWLCKNSWGKYWGDRGYYWISYEDYYLFDSRFGSSYAFCDVEPYSNFENKKMLYQNEIYGATYEFEYIGNFDTLTYINVFDTNDDYRELDKINFESTSQGAKYSLYLIPLSNSGNPTTNVNRWTLLYDGTIDYKGYHSIDIENREITTDKFAIGVEITKTNGSNNGIGVCEWLSTGGELVFNPAAERGECYINMDGYMMEALDFYKDYLSDDVGGTFVIKAVALNSTPAPTEPPTQAPTDPPTEPPTEPPTDAPTTPPTDAPTEAPTNAPSDPVTEEPTYVPPVEPTQALLIGDLDGDNAISIMDATYIQRYLASLCSFSDRQLMVADFDWDLNITIMDATAIQKYLAGY